jgi:hypothetical protein
MATVANNVLMNGLSGRFGNTLVFRTMRGKTHVSPPARKPDKKKESDAQRGTRTKFSEATQWAQAALLDPQKKEYYRQRAKALKLPNAYTAAITDYMRKPKVEKTQYDDNVTYRISKPGFALKQLLVADNEGTGAPASNIVVWQQHDQWLVNHTRDSSNLLAINLVILDNTGQEIRFVDVPSKCW